MEDLAISNITADSCNSSPFVSFICFFLFTMSRMRRCRNLFSLVRKNPEIILLLLLFFCFLFFYFFFLFLCVPSHLLPGLLEGFLWVYFFLFCFTIGKFFGSFFLGDPWARVELSTRFGAHSVRSFLEDFPRRFSIRIVSFVLLALLLLWQRRQQRLFIFIFI